MSSFVVYRTTIPKGFKIEWKVKKKKTRKEIRDYIEIWKNLAKELRVKP